MKRLSKEQILMLHSQLIKQTGGIDGVRDFNLLESAIETPFQVFAEEELYPTIQAKGTRLGYGLIKNHCMLDGNKRIGTHNALIASALMSNDIKEFELEDAVSFMVDAFVSILTDSLRTMLAYVNYFYKKKDYVSAREALLWLIDLLESLKMDKNASCYVDKVIAPCYSDCANLSLLLGETDKVEPYMRHAYKEAMLFDLTPTIKMENIKFCIGDIQNATIYDEIGESASAAVIKQITHESRNEQLLSIWKKIVEEETCGGAE